MTIKSENVILGSTWLAALAAILGIGALINVQAERLPEPVFRDIDYASVDPKRNRLDLYLPDNGKERPPLVIWIHGGGWHSGDKAAPAAINRLLKEGFAVASINYRLSTTAKWPAQLEDVGAAIRMLRTNGGRLGYDGSRVALFGASAGGHLASVAGLAFAADPTARVSAIVNWYGPSDLQMVDADLAAVGRKSPYGPAASPTSSYARLIGAPMNTAPEQVKAASPLTYVQGQIAAPPPFLIMHGDADDVVAPAQSARLNKALTDKFGPKAADYVLVHGAGHGDRPFDLPPVENRVISFLKRHLNAG